MKLLIVDDQESVVEGLLHGVDWERLGFDTVDTAYSAREAKESLEGRPAEVMLCDIEMPGGSGLDLLEWIREKSIETRCLFLTAYAKFDYARDALRLGSSDYIVQPAPYSEIADRVRKIISEVETEQNARELQRQGKLFGTNRKVIVANAYRNMLMGIQNEESYQSLAEGDVLPGLEQTVWLTLLQRIWQEDCARPKRVTAAGLQEIVDRLFSPLQVSVVVVSMPEDQEFALVSRHPTDGLNRETAEAQLDSLYNLCQEKLGLTCALYTDGRVPLKDLEQAWQKLLRRKENNIARDSGIFDTDQDDVISKVSDYISNHLESQLWREELAEVVHLNPDYLTRRFKKEMGISLREYVINQKMQEARALIRSTGLPVSFVAAKVGYSNFSHFSNSYKRQFGVTPQEDRQI